MCLKKNKVQAFKPEHKQLPEVQNIQLQEKKENFTRPFEVPVNRNKKRYLFPLCFPP
jgi:hypothetical protein